MLILHHPNLIRMNLQINSLLVSILLLGLSQVYSQTDETSNNNLLSTDIKYSAEEIDSLTPVIRQYFYEGNYEKVLEIAPTLIADAQEAGLYRQEYRVRSILGNSFVTLKEAGRDRNPDELRKEINELITEKIGAIAKLDKIQFTMGLPKTRSGKIMRRILRKIATGEGDQLGDISTLLNPDVVAAVKEGNLSL